MQRRAFLKCKTLYDEKNIYKSNLKVLYNSPIFISILKKLVNTIVYPVFEYEFFCLANFSNRISLNLTHSYQHMKLTDDKFSVELGYKLQAQVVISGTD